MGISTGNDHPQGLRAGFRRAAAPLLLCAALVAVGVFAYQASKGAVTQGVAGDMEAVARLKAGEIQLWLAERGESLRLVDDPPFVATLRAWLAGGMRDRGQEQALLGKLQFVAARHYRQVAMLSPVDGRPLLATGGPYPDRAAVRDQAVRSAKRGETLLDDVRAAEGDAATLTVGLFRPVRGPAGEALAVIYATMDLGEVLLPLVEAWPSASKSAETVLVRREGDEVVYLGKVRHDGAPALGLRRPLAQGNLVAARLIREGAGFYEEKDYRDVPSLAYGMPVAGTPWYVIAKIDRAEAFADLNVIAAACAAMLGMVAVACGWWLVRRRRDDETQQRLNRTIRLLSDCSRVLIEADSEQGLLDAICALAVETGGYRMAWIGVPCHDADKTVRAVSRCGYDAFYLKEAAISWADTEAGRGPTGTAIREGRTQVNQDFRTNASTARWRDAALAHGYESSVALPLLLNKEAIGALAIYSSMPHAFGTEEVKLLEELARDLAHGIASLRLRVAHACAEEELRFNEERMRGLFGSISDALFVHGMRSDGKPDCFVEVNDVACRRLGYTREELLAMSPLDIEAPGCAADTDPMVERLLADGSAMFETVHVAKDGRRIPVEVSSSTFILRGKRMFVSLARDVAERRRFEQERVEAEHQLATLSAHLVAVREGERAIIARELHDELGQVLTALKMDVSWVKGQTQPQTEIAGKLDDMTSLVDRTLSTVRRIAADLRPTMLDDLGLPAAIEWLVEEFAKRHPHIACKLVLDFGDAEVDEAHAIAAYRVVQECLTNVARHAEATKLHIMLGIRAGRRLVISIEDNGRGLDPDADAGFGLIGMRQRVQALGGTFHADSVPGEGMTVDVVMPACCPSAETAA